MERVKMNRADRAKQFAPFDALKGLHDALKVKEYEHERIAKGDITEEKAIEMSRLLINLEKDDNLYVEYYSDGQILSLSGKAVLEIEKNMLKIVVR